MIQPATKVSFAFLPRIESPRRLTHKYTGVELSRSLITKNHTGLARKAWNEIATPLLYDVVLFRGSRVVSVVRGSAKQRRVRLGHYVKRKSTSR